MQGRTGTRARSRLAQKLEKLEPKDKLRIAIGTGLVAIVITFATCGGCGRSGSTTGPASPTGASGTAEEKNAAPFDAGSRRDHLMWTRAKEGAPEDIATLAVHEGAIGLVEAADDAELRPTALRAMAYAPGWAHLPFLARVAAGKSDEDAKLALESIVELSVRARTAEDPEDAEELATGCKTLAALAKDTAQARARRVPAIRALRMMPCPPEVREGLPTDVDTK